MSKKSFADSIKPRQASPDKPRDLGHRGTDIASYKVLEAFGFGVIDGWSKTMHQVGEDHIFFTCQMSGITPQAASKLQEILQSALCDALQLEIHVSCTMDPHTIPIQITWRLDVPSRGPSENARTIASNLFSDDAPYGMRKLIEYYIQRECTGYPLVTYVEKLVDHVKYPPESGGRSVENLARSVMTQWQRNRLWGQDGGDIFLTAKLPLDCDEKVDDVVRVLTMALAPLMGATAGIELVKPTPENRMKSHVFHLVAKNPLAQADLDYIKQQLSAPEAKRFIETSLLATSTGRHGGVSFVRQ